MGYPPLALYHKTLKKYRKDLKNMDFKKLLSEAIDNNTKIIITGKSGWGKSEMIQQVADEKGLELIDFRLSEVLPEDLVGIPKVKGDFYEYVPPKWLYEVVNNPEKKYLLFLDEITQGTPEVLNICYKIFDKVTKVGNYTLNNVAVVGATNYQNESNYLSELPQPLQKRACMLELKHDATKAVDYLMTKYNFTDDLMKRALYTSIDESNPRSTEKALTLIMNGCSRDLCIPYVGLQSYMNLSSIFKKVNKPEGISNLDSAQYDMNQGFTELKGTKYRISEPEILKFKYSLSDEEYALIKDEYENSSMPRVEGLRNTFMSDWAALNPQLTATDLVEISKCRSFNGINYLQKMKITLTTMTNQFEVLKVIMNKNDEDLLRMICEKRTLPIEVMRLYRSQLPWDLLLEAKNKGWLTANKCAEFANELAYAQSIKNC